MPTICANCGHDYPNNLPACDTRNAPNPRQVGFNVLTPDLFWDFILPALDPEGAVRLSQVNEEMTKIYNDELFKENVGGPPLGARVGDFFSQHARLMSNPNTTAVEIQRLLGAGNRLRGVVHNLPQAAENPPERREAQLKLLEQARRSLLLKLAQLKPLAVARR